MNKHCCRQCGKPFRLRTVDGLRYARSLVLSRMDKEGLFCTLACAAEYGITAIAVKEKDKPHDQPSIH
jgi:hypothetical protein